MIDFNYTAPELLPLRIQEVLDAPDEPHRIGGVVYVPKNMQESRWTQLFGTPERAARTLTHNAPSACDECVLIDMCEIGMPAKCMVDDRDALLGWLNQEVDA